MKAGTDIDGNICIWLPNGESMVFDSAENNSKGVSFVRFYDADGEEDVGWVSDEWKEDPQGVMGAILGRLCETIRTRVISPADIEISVGDVVRTNYGYRGIVIKENEDPPSREWLALQADPRMCERAERWFTVFPFSGGSVHSPEGITKRLRRATDEDLLRAFKAGNPFAKDEMAEAFPGRVPERP